MLSNRQLLSERTITTVLYKIHRSYEHHRLCLHKIDGSQKSANLVA